MQPMRNAISSRQATIRPCRASIVWMNVEACSSASCVPVSSQAMPRPEPLDVQPPLPQIRAVDVGDLELAARRRPQTRRDVDHPVVVEVESGHGARRARPRGLFLDAHRPAGGVELDDAVALGIAHEVGEDRRARRRGRRRARSDSGRPWP